MTNMPLCTHAAAHCACVCVIGFGHACIFSSFLRSQSRECECRDLRSPIASHELCRSGIARRSRGIYHHFARHEARSFKAHWTLFLWWSFSTPLRHRRAGISTAADLHGKLLTGLGNLQACVPPPFLRSHCDLRFFGYEVQLGSRR